MRCNSRLVDWFKLTDAFQSDIDIFYASTGSKGGATVMVCLIIIMTLCSTISNVATASRQMFAFARDRGLPFANTLSYVSRRADSLNMPVLQR